MPLLSRSNCTVRDRSSLDVSGLREGLREPADAAATLEGEQDQVELPVELWSEALARLSTKERFRTAPLVCKLWRRELQSSLAWRDLQVKAPLLRLTEEVSPEEKQAALGLLRSRGEHTSRLRATPAGETSDVAATQFRAVAYPYRSLIFEVLHDTRYFPALKVLDLVTLDKHLPASCLPCIATWRVKLEELRVCLACSKAMDLLTLKQLTALKRSS